MAAIINKRTLEHIAELARLELSERETEKFLKDLQDILEHFNDLKEVNTEGVEPMAGGTSLKNIWREDEERINTNLGSGVHAFPETEGGYLKVPKIFE
jgi:aspartyl/glutamyl-tRNA(Asn/Gln) amidotransferase C subunit